MSINGNRIVGPIEGIDCVLAARTFTKFGESQNRVIYTFVDYPGVGHIWISKGFLQMQNLKHISINVDFDSKTFAASLLDHKLQTTGSYHPCTGIGNPDHDELESIGFLSSSGDKLAVSSDKPDNNFSIENTTQGKLYAGQWYTPTHGCVRLKLKAFKTLPPTLDSAGNPTTYFRNFDTTQTELIDAEISFIPYSTKISIFSDGCSFVEDKTLAMKFFDGWASKDSSYRQSGCVGYLRESSKNCLFIGSLLPPGEHGHFDSIITDVGCNRGYGYSISDECGTHTLGNCESGTCARTNDSEGFACFPDADTTHVFLPETLQDTRHSKKNNTLIIILISIFVFLIFLAIFTKIS